MATTDSLKVGLKQAISKTIHVRSVRYSLEQYFCGHKNPETPGMTAFQGFGGGGGSNLVSVSRQTLSRAPRYGHFGTPPFILKL